MKKLIALLLCLVMVLTLAACGDKKEENKGNNGGAKVEVPASSLEILEKVWAEFTDAEKEYLPIGGGDSENMVMDAPGAFNVELTDELVYALLVPADQADKIDGAASMMNMMMSNNFTCGAFHLKNASDTKAFAEAMETAVQGNQWMCGMPEHMIVATVGGEYVVMAYGLNDNISALKTHLTAVYPAAELVCDEAVTG